MGKRAIREQAHSQRITMILLSYQLRFLLWTWLPADDLAYELANVFGGLTIRRGRWEGEVLVTLKTQLVYDDKHRNLA